MPARDSSEHIRLAVQQADGRAHGAGIDDWRTIRGDSVKLALLKAKPQFHRFQADVGDNRQAHSDLASDGVIQGPAEIFAKIGIDSADDAWQLAFAIRADDTLLTGKVVVAGVTRDRAGKVRQNAFA